MEALIAIDDTFYQFSPLIEYTLAPLAGHLAKTYQIDVDLRGLQRI